ncbi:hypothetical protein K470DRAFT_286956 [Piedraia hortae CBS 480.64]|uniref:non-specific serine/threonine protein kinase n=1 Tax=Piedraia hortae CBS 480.64 TaxID=1314780 RepID=A0A6A7BY98_9PEZI|nr:hypothetical protein K470DRAFT_286956 [Piedraia hortae CBS 480.64]
MAHSIFRFPYYCGLPGCENICRYVLGGYYPVHIGDILHNGCYRILQKLGNDSFSTIWATRDEQEQRFVALKIPVADARSSLETTILKTLASSGSKHPGISYLHVLRDEFELIGLNGTHSCIVTDVYGVHVGLDLENRCVSLNASAARRLQQQVLQALDCLHQYGIVHGDLYSGKVVWTVPGVNSLTEEKFLRFFKTHRLKK